MVNETTNSAKKCAVCKEAINCLANDIQNCECSKVSLTADQQEIISNSYTDCLCNRCLIRISEEGIQSTDINNTRNRVSTLVYIFILLFFVQHFFSQVYPPAAGMPGTTAMFKDSSAFVNWASGCTIVRGFQDISNSGGGQASVGDGSMALGKALSNGVVSLGDGGSATCTFNSQISNGPGFDFAVFENSIDDTFLELAFVEVSSDGVNFFRFPAHSLTDTINQTGGFGSTDASKIDNLAGKYRSGYGTPFDLQVLNGKLGLNVNAISHVKIIDVVGSLNNSYTTRDSYGNKVNDPWPTPFPSGGFDLDAIGVIHPGLTSGFEDLDWEVALIIFPNPVQNGELISVRAQKEIQRLELQTLDGKILLRENGDTISTSAITEGFYFLKIFLENTIQIRKITIE